MLNALQDKRRKRMMLEQGNPELNVGDPGIKRQSKAGLMAEQLSVPDAKQTMEGVKRIQNDSENKSKDDSNTMLAYTGGWGEILNEVFASENQSPEFKEQKTNLSTSSTETEPPLEDPDIKTSGDLESFVANFEKFSATPYDDFKQTSIGYGSKSTSKNQTVTEEEAKKLLKRDLNNARKVVLKMKKDSGYAWNDNQVDALTSFTHNLGAGNLKKLTENGTRGDEEISDMLLEYKYAGGKVREGLIKRREAELKLFNEGY